MIVKAKIRSDIADGNYKTPILDDRYNGGTLFLLKPGDDNNVRHLVERSKPMVKVKYFDITGLVDPYVIDGLQEDEL